MIPSKPCLLGIDLGTSACKCAILRGDGELLASSTVPYPTHTPQPGWTEQDPADWQRSALSAVKTTFETAGIPARQVAAIGLSGQMHTAVFTGRGGQVLRPAVVWSDQRAAPQVEQVLQKVGLEHLLALTGNRLAAGFTLATWLWVKENEPSVYQETRALLLPKDTLRLFLCGETGSEPSDASATLLFDPVRMEWCQPLLDELDLDSAALPPLNPSAGVAGGLLAEAARQTGLLAGTPLVFGGSDQSMQALGCGIIHPGQVSSALGTGGQLFAPLTAPSPDPQGRLHLFCHALPNTWHLEAAVLSAGASLRWLRGVLAPAVSFDELAAEAQAVLPGAEGLSFLPYLAGERTPYFKPELRGVFSGLSLQHTRAHLVRAVMEGVVYAMRQGLELIRERGIHPTEISATGAAAAHPLWLQLQADIFNLPVRSLHGASTAAAGAALLAGIGIGLYAGADEAVRVINRSSDDGLPGRARNQPGSPDFSKPPANLSDSLIYPDSGRNALYEDLFKRYVELANSGLALPPAP